MIEGIVCAVLLAALVGLQARGLWRLRRMDEGVRAVLKIAGQSSRITSAKPTAARDRVHLVLMDESERTVDIVMVVAPEQRAYEVQHGRRMYACVSGSVEDGYFVYRAKR